MHLDRSGGIAWLVWHASLVLQFDVKIFVFSILHLPSGIYTNVTFFFFLIINIVYKLNYSIMS